MGKACESLAGAGNAAVRGVRGGLMSGLLRFSWAVRWKEAQAPFAGCSALGVQPEQLVEPLGWSRASEPKPSKPPPVPVAQQRKQTPGLGFCAEVGGFDLAWFGCQKFLKLARSDSDPV